MVRQLQMINFGVIQVISVGIDVSKEKSMVCILKPYGEIIRKPYEIEHTEKELGELISLIKKKLW